MKCFYPYTNKDSFRCYSDYNSRKNKYEFGIQKRFNILGIKYWVTITKKYSYSSFDEPIFKIGCIKYKFYVIADLLNKYVKS